MTLRRNFLMISVLAAAFMFFGSTAANAQDSDYSFTVNNNTRLTIKKLLVAEPGSKNWSYFDIGSGIKSGKSTLLVWSRDTDTQGCVQWIKAVYSDNSATEPVRFDFCEEDLVLDFDL